MDSSTSEHVHPGGTGVRTYPMALRPELIHESRADETTAPEDLDLHDRLRNP